MFVKTTRIKRDNKTYEYLTLVEAVREGDKTGHRTLFRLGEASALRATGELDRIIAALSAHAEGHLVPAEGIVAEAAPSLGAIAAVWAVWRRLGLDRWFEQVGAQRGATALEHAAFAMVANRLVDPCSKRRLREWVDEDVAMPAEFVAPSADQYYRALDAIAATKDTTETHIYSRVTDLTNLDLRLVCYDLTSTYFEGTTQPSQRFPSRAFGYSRDHRSDRPQIVIGLLCTGDGIPIAHHVFAGNTADVSTLPGVLDDLQTRFGVGRICVVADRGLISTDNVDELTRRRFDHLLATRLHHDALCKAALEASSRPDAAWVPAADAHAAACETTVDGRRCVVVASLERYERDTRRSAELIARTETQLLKLEARVRDGRLVDPGKIGRAAQRILGASGVGRLFTVDIGPGQFSYDYNDPAHDYEALLAGRYVLTTSLTQQQASTAAVVRAYRQLLEVERRFRTLKDFLRLRPVRHWTERRVRGHVAVCVYAAVLETLIGKALRSSDVHDPDLESQHLSAARALRELARIRAVTLTAGEHTIDTVTRPNALQARILSVLDVDTTDWTRPAIT